MGSYDRFKLKATKTLTTTLGILAGVSLCVATLVMFANIVVRPFGHAIRFVYDLVGLCAAFAAALSIPYTALKRDHSIMDILLAKFPPKLRAILETSSGIIGFAMIFLMMYAGGSYAFEKTQVFEKTVSAGLPTWIFRWVWVLGMALILVALAFEIIDHVRKALGKKVYLSLDEAEDAGLEGGDAE